MGSVLLALWWWGVRALGIQLSGWRLAGFLLSTAVLLVAEEQVDRYYRGAA